MQHNYLALDSGEKRIGLAVGSLVPFGRGYLDATDEAHVIAHLAHLIEKEAITALVIGIPHVKSGEVTQSGQRAVDMAEKLKSEFGLPLFVIDESLTSVEAERQLRSEGIDWQHDKGKVDERAAMLILEEFLQTHGN